MKFKSLFCTLLCTMAIIPMAGIKNANAGIGDAVIKTKCAISLTTDGMYCVDSCCRPSLASCRLDCESGNVVTPPETDQCAILSAATAYDCSSTCQAPSSSLCSTCCTTIGGETGTVFCMAGKYSSKGTCYDCPEPGTSKQWDATSITDCYVPANTEQSDASGKYVFTEKCNYTNLIIKPGWD